MTHFGSGGCIAARISLGCPLSPLIGALFLNAPDAAAARLRLFYYSLHRRHPYSGTNPLATSRCRQVSTGCSGRSVWRNIRTFLGYHFSLAGLTVAKQTLSNFIERTSQLNRPQPAALYAGVLQHHLGTLLSNHHRRRIGIARSDIWHDRSINDA